MVVDVGPDSHVRIRRFELEVHGPVELAETTRWRNITVIAPKAYDVMAEVLTDTELYSAV